MAILKCKMCGGALDVIEGQSVCTCSYCGTEQTIPSADNEKKMNLFVRANELRLNCEFDKAMGVYESIVAEFTEEAEAYWGLVLCKYGIEYVDDAKTGKKIPTCHRTSYNDVLKDSDYQAAIRNADSVAHRKYMEEAEEIEKLRKEIIEISSEEEAYDIFICYKETDDSGERTIDSVLAQKVYDELISKGYKVFFSRITLESKLGQKYEPYIFAALNSAKVMLSFGTRSEYFNAVWVKNEWSRFLSLMEKGEKKTLIPCYKDMSPYDLPSEFRNLQSQDIGKVGAIQDIVRGIEKIIGKKRNPEQATVTNNAEMGECDRKYKSAMHMLKLGDHKEALKMFEYISKEYAWSYKGWYGQFLIAKDGEFNEELCSLVEKVRAGTDLTEDIREELDEYLKNTKERYLEEGKKRLSGYVEERDKLQKEYDSFEGKMSIQQKEYKEKKWELANDKSVQERNGKIIQIVVMGVAIVAALFIGKQLLSWLIGSTKGLFHSASLESSVINRVWQYFLYGVWTFIKGAICLTVTVGIGTIPFSFGAIFGIERDNVNSNFAEQEAVLQKEKEQYKAKLALKRKYLKQSQKACEDGKNIVDACEKLDVNNVETYRTLARLKASEPWFLSVVPTVGGSVAASDDTVTSDVVTMGDDAVVGGEEKTDFNVELTEVGPNKVKLIKAIREITGLGLAEVKDMVDSAPIILKKGVGKAEAEEMKKTLEEEGAKVILKELTLSQEMNERRSISEQKTDKTLPDTVIYFNKAEFLYKFNYSDGILTIKGKNGKDSGESYDYDRLLIDFSYPVAEDCIWESDMLGYMMEDSEIVELTMTEYKRYIEEPDIHIRDIDSPLGDLYITVEAGEVVHVTFKMCKF